MKKVIACSAICLFQMVYAAQSIQVAVHLPDNSSDANLLLLIDDMDTGRKTPESFYLHAGDNLATFHVQGDHYQLIPVKLLAPHQEFIPCHPSPQINNHSLIMTITGNIETNMLQCHYRETATLLQLSAPASAGTALSSVSSTTPASSSGVTASTAGFAGYLTHLLQNCQQGDFLADFGGQKVDYAILGMKSGLCEVSISTGKDAKPLLCQFTGEDIAMMASPSRIAEAEKGQLQYSASDLTARIMQARCHAL